MASNSIQQVPAPERESISVAEATVPDGRAPSQPAWIDRVRSLSAASGMLPALLLLILVGSVISPDFLTSTNISNVLRLGAVIGLLSVGQTLVILSGGGGIDLSVAGVAAAAAIVGANYQAYGLEAVIGGSLLTGAFFGLVNGLGVTTAGLQPFVITLATMTIARGVGFELTNAQPVYVQMHGLSTLSQGSIAGVPVPIVIFGAVVLVGQVLLSRSIFGRNLYAIGGNEDAAFASGINVRAYRIGVYMICGLLAGLAGVLGMAQLSTADPNFANGYELSSIAAVVVGGALLAGGRGTILGTLVGVLIMAFLSNLLALKNVNPWTNLMVTGVIILVVVGLKRHRGQHQGRVWWGLPLYASLVLGAFLLYFVIK